MENFSKQETYNILQHHSNGRLAERQSKLVGSPKNWPNQSYNSWNDSLEERHSVNLLHGCQIQWFIQPPICNNHQKSKHQISLEKNRTKMYFKAKGWIENHVWSLIRKIPWSSIFLVWRVIFPALIFQI